MRIPVAVLAIAALTPAQPPPASSLIGTIEFRVTTTKGEAVSGLRADDLTLRVGGRDRRIRSLDVITPVQAAETATLGGALPPPFVVTPAADTGVVRHVMLIIDEGFIAFGSEQPLKDGVARLIAALSPRDRLALASLRPGGAQIDYTTDRGAIQAAANAIVGGRAANDPSHLRIVLSTIRTVVGSLPPGLSSSVLLLSGGGSVAGPVSMQRDTPMPGGRVQPEEIRAVEQAIQLSQVNAHVVHVGATISQGLNNLAGSIGAGTALLSFADATTLARIVAPSAHHYRLSFDGDTSDKPGTTQRVELRIARADGRVHAPSIVALRARHSPATMSSIIRSASSSRDIPMRAASFPSMHQGNRVKIVVLFEPIDPAVTLAGAVVAAFDEADQMVSQSTMRPSDLAARPLVAALSLTPGKYRVRVAAIDAAGRTGTVDESIRAELQPAGALRMSGLVLGTRLDGGKFVPKLQFSGDEPSASAYMEVYLAGSHTTISVSFEIADSENGPATRSVAGTIERGPGDAVIAIGDLPIGGLAAGDALVRAVVSVAGAPAGRSIRTLRKIAR